MNSTDTAPPDTEAEAEDMVRPQGRPPGHSGAAERDEAVFALLAASGEAGMTRNAVLEALRDGSRTREERDGHTKSRVYWALKRLRQADRIRTCAPPKGKGRELVWSVGPSCP